MTNAIAARGVTLTRDGNLIAEIDSISPPEVKRETIDSTNFDSADDAREFIAGLIDGGEMSFEANFIAGDTDGQVALESDLESGEAVAFVITFPTSITATFSFNAIVTSFKLLQMKKGEKVSFSCTVKVTGLPALAIGASTGLTTPFFSIATATVYPDPANDVYEYVGVSTGVSVTVTPTATAGVIKVNGSTVATGVPSSAISLGDAGDITTITITVTETGKVTKTYTVLVAKTA
ncbi:hypothetical protein M0R72_11460 [Candidatus Pacearchaeota archaeon]|jgi:hypothetical protein|nr:hypothetical protein [Candidatus Pacearchaeota archaeon]